MKFFKKSAISTAMATAFLASGMLVTQQASALPVGNSTASDIAVAGAPVAADTYVNPNGLGQALIYPYYTVRDGYRTTFNVFNTSDRAVAVKVRFREYQNSRDVLDFNLVLSPNDKWSGTVTEAASSGAILGTADSSCTVPAIPAGGAAFSADGYSFSGGLLDFVDSGDQDLERLKSGYIEIIPMGWTTESGSVASFATDEETGDADTLFTAALHDQPDGVPYDCSQIVDAFTPRDDAWDLALDSEPGDGDPAIVDAIAATDADPGWQAIPEGQNPLYGELALINVDGGVAGGTNAIALADWMDADVTLFTAQEFPYYLEPTLATSAGVWDTSNLGAVDAALTSATVVNEWANNTSNGAQVTWVVTMPTKSFHVDIDLENLEQDGFTADTDNIGNIQAGVNDWRNVGANADGGNAAGTTATEVAAGLAAPFENPFASGVSEMSIDISMYGSEEGESSTGPTGSVSFSPGSFTTTSATLKYEANTIAFNGAGLGDTVLNSANPLELDPVNDVEGGKVSGHMRLEILGTNTAIIPAVAPDPAIPVGEGEGTGLPMLGFALKDRDTGDSALSFGQLLDHKWFNAP